jgi:hypothetical protein
VVGVIVAAAVDEVALLVVPGGLVTQGCGEVMAAIDVLHRSGRREFVVAVVVAETAVAERGMGHDLGGRKALGEGQEWMSSLLNAFLVPSGCSEWTFQRTLFIP